MMVNHRVRRSAYDLLSVNGIIELFTTRGSNENGVLRVSESKFRESILCTQGQFTRRINGVGICFVIFIMLHRSPEVLRW